MTANLGSIAMLFLAVAAFSTFAWFCFSWRFAMASVVCSDYTPEQQVDDVWRHGSVVPTKRGFSRYDTEDQRLISEEVEFTDEQGALRRTTTHRYVYAGLTPNKRYPILHRRQDPQTALIILPTSWLELVTMTIGAISTAFLFIRQRED